MRLTGDGGVEVRLQLVSFEQVRVVAEIKNAGRKVAQAGNGREAGVARRYHETRVCWPLIPPTKQGRSFPGTAAVQSVH